MIQSVTQFQIILKSESLQNKIYIIIICIVMLQPIIFALFQTFSNDHKPCNIIISFKNASSQSCET